MTESVRSERLSELPTDDGAAVLHAIGLLRERFLVAQRALDRRQEVLAARSGMDCRDAGDGAWLEF